MITLIRTNSEDENFKKLVSKLDEDLAIRDGDEHDFYHQFNGLDTIKHVVVAYNGKLPLGCGAIKKYDTAAAEVKRMYTAPESRGKGIATKILAELELWAKELSFQKCILETGLKQPEAIQLYKKNGYKIIPNYGQYAAAENSVCFEKTVK
ncbi:GNAT family N-acetyltransferase [Ulvibacter litoralis]|uniref:Acetyltransferase (GNAT) domain-containing protein n=1 Tax=Ulvibacter litoralis TaxID=227084 RepID=A0A1G7DRU8_9FLAO|nr:GNAT family N-acetyltransferase [Ulvibacter litoralis]GHC42616.1 N-acetyltransferase [Ulvibacter litoralis]SDE53896.1 Acetyltransferase (GNAT) domain-containing protein [Ulvibacter litoralis]